MKKIPLFIVLLLLIVNTSVGYAQKDIVCKGTITDSITRLPLEDVRIYKIFNSDTVMFQTNPAGEFQISLQAGSKLFLKKTGYAWRIVSVSDNKIQQIKMKPSTPSSGPLITRTDTGKSFNNEDVDLYFNGQLVPFSEMNDALDIHGEEIISVSLKTGEKRGEMYIETR